jgi:glycosyltransferase involved in cell wall biosynthesis
VQISVIIPFYNRAHTLPRALDSVLAQTSHADEIILVDDGSSDSGAELIRHQYPEVSLLQQPNLGVSAARNTGIRHARYDWIALLDSDDEWQPDKLARIRETQQVHTDAWLIHSDEIWIRNGHRVNPMNKHRKYGGMIFEHCLPLCVISPSAVVMRRSLFDDIGLFDESLPACEDYDLWLRLCHRYPVYFIDEPLITKYGGHDDQLSRRYWGMDRFRIQSLHRLIQTARLDATQRSLAIDTLVGKARILLEGARKHGNADIQQQFQPLLERYEAEVC